MPRRRLDVELVRRGLASSRAEAQAAVEAGLVTVAGSPATKAASLVAADVPVQVLGPARRFVSRGGEKLRAALDRFGVDPRGRDCLDAGASTGGFTDCLLQAGAGRVVAVDVGYGQLAWEVRNDPRVTVMERTNVRTLEPADLPFAPELVVADLSFISLRAVLPALVRAAAPDAEFVVLVKPQFEAGPGRRGERGRRAGPGGLATRARRGGRTRSARWRWACSASSRRPCGARRGTWSSCSTAGVGWMMHTVDLDAAVTEGEGLPR